LVKKTDQQTNQLNSYSQTPFKLRLSSVTKSPTGKKSIDQQKHTTVSNTRSNKSSYDPTDIAERVKLNNRLEDYWGKKK